MTEDEMVGWHHGRPAKASPPPCTMCVISPLQGPDAHSRPWARGRVLTGPGRGPSRANSHLPACGTPSSHAAFPPYNFSLTCF